MTKTLRAGTQAPESGSTSRVVLQGEETSAGSSSGNEVAGEFSSRRQMIETAAYLRAQERGFPGGTELQDWLEAEAEIDRALAGTSSAAR